MLGQSKSTNRKGWPTEGQSIYTLPHIYANRKVWGTQNGNSNSTMTLMISTDMIVSKIHDHNPLERKCLIKRCHAVKEKWELSKTLSIFSSFSPLWCAVTFFLLDTVKWSRTLWLLSSFAVKCQISDLWTISKFWSDLKHKISPKFDISAHKFQHLNFECRNQ